MPDVSEGAVDLTASGSQWDVDTDETQPESLESQVAKQLQVEMDAAEKPAEPKEPEKKTEKKVEPVKGEAEGGEAKEPGWEDEEGEEGEEGEKPEKEPEKKTELEAGKKPSVDKIEDAKTRLKAILDELEPDARTKLLGTSDQKFAAITAKGQRVREREEAVAGREKQLGEAEAENTKYREGVEALLKGARENPLEALKVLGWTFEEAVEFVTNDEKVSETKKREFFERARSSELEKREKALNEREKQAKESEQRTNETAWVGKLEGLVRDAFGADKYPLCQRFSPDQIGKRVWMMQQDAWKESAQKISLTPEQCMSTLEENLQKEFELLTGQKFSAPSPQRTGDANEASKPEGNETQTLTGQLTAQRGTAPRASETHFDTEDDDDVATRERAERARLASVLEND